MCHFEERKQTGRTLRHKRIKHRVTFKSSRGYYVTSLATLSLSLPTSYDVGSCTVTLWKNPKIYFPKKIVMCRNKVCLHEILPKIIRERSYGKIKRIAVIEKS